MYSAVLLMYFISAAAAAIPQLAEGIMADLGRDFWIRETGTGQQVAQLHDRYMMMMMIYICIYIYMTLVS